MISPDVKLMLSLDFKSWGRIGPIHKPYVALHRIKADRRTRITPATMTKLTFTSKMPALFGDDVDPFLTSSLIPPDTEPPEPESPALI